MFRNSQKPGDLTMRAVWQLLSETASGWFNVNAQRLGAALAFYTMLSLAPLLLIAIAIAGLAFGREAAQGQIVWQLQDLVGVEGGKAVQAMLEAADKPASGVFAGVVGLLILLFGASGVFVELRDSLNLIWGVKSASGAGLMGMVKYRFASFAMVLGIGFLLIVSLVLSAVIAGAGKVLGGMMPIPEAVLHLANLTISFLAVTGLFALIYKLVPDVEIEWRDVWIGAAVTSLLFSLGKFVIGLYLGKASVGSAYGAAGSLVVLLVWVYYSAQIFFFGAEFTEHFAQRHGSRSQPKPLPETESEHSRFRHPKLA
jgi:membrane protein